MQPPKPEAGLIGNVGDRPELLALKGRAVVSADALRGGAVMSVWVGDELRREPVLQVCETDPSLAERAAQAVADGRVAVGPLVTPVYFGELPPAPS